MHGTEFEASPDHPSAARRPLRAWIMSDVHLETAPGWDLPPKDERPACDVVVIAGDLTTRIFRGVRWLQKRLPDVDMLYIAGNHEYWHGDLDRTIDEAKVAAEGSRVHVLSVGDRVQVGDMTFIGVTTWTDFSLFEHGLVGRRRRARQAADDAGRDRHPYSTLFSRSS